MSTLTWITEKVLVLECKKKKGRPISLEETSLFTDFLLSLKSPPSARDKDKNRGELSDRKCKGVGVGGRRKYSFFFLALLARSRRADYRKEKKATFVYRLEETHENVIATVRKGKILAATKVKMFGCEKKNKK